MKRTILLVFSLLGCALLALAQTTNPAPPAKDSKGTIGALPQDIFTKRPNPDDLASAPRITVADLKKLLDSGKAVVVDVRSLDSFKAGRIPGSRSIPLIDIPTRGKELSGDKVIVTYCS